MKRLINIVILLFSSLFAITVLSGKIKVDCLFKRILGISCPGCGLTRSIKSFIKLDIITSFKYNIFGPILFILFIVSIIFLIRDIIKNEDKTIKYIYKLFSKYYYIIIICLIISMIINNIRGI